MQSVIVLPGGGQKMKAADLNDTEINLKGIEALNKTLGTTAALRFLTMLHHEPTDYVSVSHRLYEGQSVDEIFARAKKDWKG